MRNRAKAKGLVAGLFAAASTMVPLAAASHPHAFAEASLEVMVGEGGAMRSLSHLWRFDDMFSSTVLFAFDKNRDLVLDKKELEEVAALMHQSLADFDYFQVVTQNDRVVEMEPPPQLIATFDDQRLAIMFESRPVEPLELTGKLRFGVYDPTFYTAIDFHKDEMLTVRGMPANCRSAVVRPDPYEAITQNQQTLTEAFFQNPINYSQIFTTRLELDCAGKG